MKWRANIGVGLLLVALLVAGCQSDPVDLDILAPQVEVDGGLRPEDVRRLCELFYNSPARLGRPLPP